MKTELWLEREEKGTMTSLLGKETDYGVREVFRKNEMFWKHFSQPWEPRSGRKCNFLERLS